MTIDKLMILLEDDGSLTADSYTNLGLLIERKFTQPNTCDYTMLLPDELIDLKITDDLAIDILNMLLEKVIKGDNFSSIMAWAIGRSYLDDFNRKLIKYLISSNTDDLNLIIQCLRSAEVSENNILLEYRDFLSSIMNNDDLKEIHTDVSDMIEDMDM